jgi:Tfp pilus assembly protein PilV
MNRFASNDVRCAVQKKTSGFSILEIILALAILTGAIAVLGELGRLGMRNAKATEELSRAQLLCESKMTEYTSGISTPEAVANATFDTSFQDSNVPWIYSVETAQVDQDGLISVRVTVSQNLPAAQRPVTYSLVKWMIDPAVIESLVAAQEEAAAAAASATSTTSTTSTTTSTSTSATGATNAK